MDELQGKVAVITGGASGIGLALAHRAAADGMKVVIADIEQAPLDAAVAALKGQGAEALGVLTDVRDLAAIEALRDRAVDTFGGVHLLCNNAGVGGGGRTWEASIEQWKWVIEVDLWSVIYGIRTFVPLMLTQGVGHIVNTASMAGLTSPAGMGPYNVAKHGVVTLSETLFHELRGEGAAVGVSVLCPAFVSTQIHESLRNAPDEVLAEVAAVDPAEMQPMRDMMRMLIESGIPPADVADQVFDAVVNNRFYVLTHPETPAAVRNRMERIINGEDPASAFG